ncbi:MAG: chorismate lyase [Marinobacter sp.]|uniref:chorismate--pyruvate lyase family protein n=1 Tax=Marinobacter sp. TaxID=50741 RepID=UPI00299EB530|nr:chorismate lyase [Marinobacter sp.]MDX1756361.1 chorismate lyase [Marinobacter sp.]
MPLRDFDVATTVSPPCIPPTAWYRSRVAAGLSAHDTSPAARYWLQLEGSLTRALQLRCRHRFHVEISQEGFARPTLEEARTLGIPLRQVAWIREVRLCGDGVPWVLARTVIPRSTLEGAGRRLRHLGRKPLGAFLFSDPRWQRGPLEVGRCQCRRAGLPMLARRSRFATRNGGGLLVGEYFLPALLEQGVTP